MADPLAAGRLAHAGTPIAVLENDKIPCEEGTVRAAQIQEHAVVSCYRNDLHSSDDGRSCAGRFAQSHVQHALEHTAQEVANEGNLRSESCPFPENRPGFAIMARAVGPFDGARRQSLERYISLRAAD